MNKAIFLDRDGVINKEKNFVTKPQELELYDFTAQAIRKINQSEYLAIVITNQSGIARNYYTMEDLEQIHQKLEKELAAQIAKLDDIYFCPHHPDTDYKKGNPLYQMECECRKPKSGMLIQAAADYNIDLKKSFFIGDTERDIISGKNAGVTTIGVRTGKGIKDIKTTPDYVFNNLLQAVNFILK